MQQDTDINVDQRANDTISLDTTMTPKERIPEVSVETPRVEKAVGKRLIESAADFKIAVAQISTDPAAFKENTAKIIENIQEAKRRGAKLVVFPELTIPGYASFDLLFYKTYIDDNLSALNEVMRATAGITAVVGFVDRDRGQVRSGGRPVLYNSAAIMRDGELLAIQDKTLFPNYDIFWEDRYFSPARGVKVFDVEGVKFGAEICEDLWKEGYNTDPTQRLIQLGAEAIINLSASPFHLGKLNPRRELIERSVQQHNVPFIYANLVGSFDGYEGEVVFDGRSIVMGRQAKLLGLGKGFAEDLLVVDLHSQKELLFPDIYQTEELHDALVLGIKDYFRRIGSARQANFKRAIIGLSGGIDSAVVAALAVEALGKEKVLGITMPSKYSSKETRDDARILAENLGIQFKTVPIEKNHTSFLDTIREADPEVAALPENVAEENIQARDRMRILMYYANKIGGLVLNTGNKTEIALDNCTLYGDMVGGFSVMQDVDKDRVYALAEYINKKFGFDVIPRATIERVPSAELKANQSDAAHMGAAPQVIAPLVRGIIEEGLSLTEAKDRFKGEFSEALIDRAWMLLDRSEYKRRQAAPSIRVTPRAFGVGRRVPMNHGFRG